MKHLLITITLSFSVLLLSCSGIKEETPPPKPKIEQPTVKIEKPKRTFEINDRYYVKNAVLASPTNIDEPVEAIHVIQLDPGKHQVLVLFRTEDVEESSGNIVHYETWLGIELPSFAPGTYDLASAPQIQFYKFYLGENGIRYDGKTFTGSITIEGIEDGYLIGELNIRIKGETKSFVKPTEKFDTTWKGTFRIQDVPIDATMMK